MSQSNLGQDIKRGLRENASRGFYTCGRPPYGFRKVPTRDGAKSRYRLEPEPEDSISVKGVHRIFEMALKGNGCKEIARTLNREGLYTSAGRRWGKTTVHKILNNEAYCGNLVLGGRPGHRAIHSKDKIEQLVINQVKQKVLDRQCLEELVRLVNAELDAGHTLLKDKLSNIDAERQELENRLSRLYDALETGKLNLSDLAPRIKALRTRQDELSKARVIAEAEMTLQGYQQLDIDAVRSYVADLSNILEESEVAQRKAFLRSFVKKIVIEREEVKLYYNLPVPPDGRKKKKEAAGVLPMVTPSGEAGTRTPTPFGT